MKIHINYIEMGDNSTILINLLKTYGNAVVKKVRIDYDLLKKLSDKIYSKLSLLQKKKGTNTTNTIIDKEIENDVKHLGKKLFSLLFTSVADQIIGSNDKDFTLSFDEKLSYIPFEILYDGKDFLCLKYNFSKQVLSHTFESKEIDNSRDKLNAVILSNPSLDKALEPVLNEERNQIYQKLKENKKINIIPPIVGERITTDYFDKLWDKNLIYFSGHSNSGENSGECGLKLSDNKYLTPERIEKLDLSKTNLFYINSCESALPASDNGRNLFTSFLKAGVENVIGNLIEVHNEPASSFALWVYDFLLQGNTIAESIRLSRHSSIKKYGFGELIWLVNSYYGNHSWKLPDLDVKIEKSYYLNGKLRSESRVVNGLRDGIKKDYFQSGKLADEILYVKGKKHGIKKSYYESGKLQSESVHEKGKLEGLEKGYYENGKLEYQGVYKNGKWHGTLKEYHENNKIEYEGLFEKGKEHGVHKTYHKNGNLKIETAYSNGKEYGISKEYYENGKLKGEQPCRDGKSHGMSKHYYESGKLDFENFYENGKLHGIAKSFFENGRIQIETSYVNGRKHGMQKCYNLSGKLYSEIAYENDQKHGIDKDYYMNGKLYTEKSYINGKLHGLLKEYHDNGKLESEILYENGKMYGIKKSYNDEGKLVTETSYANDKKHGIEKSYDDYGKLESETLYEFDKKNGIKYIYDIRGLPSHEFEWDNDNLINENQFDDD